MKKKLLIALLLNSSYVFAQPLPLEFSVTQEQYNYLENDTIITESNWDDEFWEVSIGFTFHYMESSYNKIFSFGPYGGFGSEVCFGEYSDEGIYDLICPALLDVMEFTGKSQGSYISYVTEGTAPNRIFKLQWKDCGLNGNVDGTMYVNYQIWLYETTNSIDFRYGYANNFNNGEVGFTLGVPAYFINNWNPASIGNNCTGMWMMNGEVMDPDFDFTFDTDELFLVSHLDDLPWYSPKAGEGIVYHFEGEEVSVPALEKEEVLLFPGIASEIVTVISGFTMDEIQIYDATGKVLQSYYPKASYAELQVSDFSDGAYCIVITCGLQRTTGKFIKQ